MPALPPAEGPPVHGTLERHRTDILIESATATLCLGLLVWFVNVFIPLDWIRDPAIHLALAVLALLGALIVLLGLGIWVTKLIARNKLNRRRVLQPGLVELLTDIARGAASPADLKSAWRRYPDLIEDLVADVLSIQKGAGLLRIAEAAEICGIPELWKHRARDSRPAVRCTSLTRLGLLPNPDCDDVFREGMEDTEELVAIEAARSVIRGRRMEAIEALLAGLPRRNRLLRALLCEWLRPHSAALSAGIIPKFFESGDPAQILAILEAMASWRRALLIPGLRALFTHPDAAIQAAAWRVVPYALGFPVAEDELSPAIASPAAEVRIAALQTVARLKLDACGSLVTRAASDPDREVSRAACFAAASLGRRAALEATSVSGTNAAPCATEALEKSLIGRLEI